MTTCDILNKINKYIKLKKKLLIFCFKKIKKEKRKKMKKEKKRRWMAVPLRVACMPPTTHMDGSSHHLQR